MRPYGSTGNPRDYVSARECVLILLSTYRGGPHTARSLASLTGHPLSTIYSALHVLTMARLVETVPASSPKRFRLRNNGEMA